MSENLQDIAKQVEERAKELEVPSTQEPLDVAFIKQCLDRNERGDGELFAALFRDKYLNNVTLQDEKKGVPWFAWDGNIWAPDNYKQVVDAVEAVALEYQRVGDLLDAEIEEQGGVDKEDDDFWKVILRDAYYKRVKKLRSKAGAGNTIYWAPIVDTRLAVKEEELNQNPWLLPVKNGVIDLEKGVLIKGRPSDRMTKVLDVEYDPRADYTLWVEVLKEITDSEEEMPNFIKRTTGYAATGFSFEQYIWIFLGPGRNGKGVFFNLINEILRPWFHTISASMLLKQRNPPSPAAATEHLYSLLNKRIAVGSETNKGDLIDAACVKDMTGEGEIVCRPNFRSEINYYPTHSLFLQTNSVPLGMTQDFALRQRMLLLEFPWRYVDDVELEKKKWPQFADRFRQKDPKLKDRLRAIKPGILRWIVEGCREWQEIGLAPPKKIIDAVDKLSDAEDYIGRFAADCLEMLPDEPNTRILCTAMYNAFEWWWEGNEGSSKKKSPPAMKTVNNGLRDKGFQVEPRGGKTWIYRCRIALDISMEVDNFVLKKRSKS